MYTRRAELFHLAVPSSLQKTLKMDCTFYSLD